MKQYIPTQQTLEALLNGARLMVVKIDDKRVIDIIENHLHDKQDDGMLKKFLLPIKQCDEIYIAEEFYPPISIEDELHIMKSKGKPRDATPASDMKPEQSRLRFTVGEVSVKRVSEITHTEWVKIENTGIGADFYENINWLKAQDIELTDNVALVELKEI